MSGSEFKAKVGAFAGSEFFRKSVLSIRGGAGVIEKLLGSGKYRRVLEIGTYRGVSAAFMAQFCEAVTTIDLVDGKMEQDRQVFDRVRLWEALGITNVDLRLVSSFHGKAQAVASATFDFAFIDGDHEGSAPRQDFDLVKHCGAVLFHDYGADNGVTKLVRALPKAQVEIMDIFAFWRAAA